MDEKMKDTLKDICGSLSDEQKAKAKQCRTMDELSDAALDEVAGGFQVNHTKLREIIEAFQRFWNAVPDNKKEGIVEYMYTWDLAGFAASVGVPIDEKLVDPNNRDYVLLAFSRVVHGIG